MDYRFSGEETSVQFELSDGIELVTPDDQQVDWKIRNNSGTVLASGNTVLEHDATSILVNVAAIHATKTLEVERRTVDISFLVNGRRLNQTKTFDLISRQFLSVSPQDIRDFIGVTIYELDDLSVGIPRAYYQARSAIGTTAFDTAIVSGTDAQRAATEAVLYRAVLNVIPSLQLRVAAKEQGDNIVFQRLTKIDFGALRNEASKLYSDAVSDLSGDDDVIPVFFTVNVPTDPVTGA